VRSRAKNYVNQKKKQIAWSETRDSREMSGARYQNSYQLQVAAGLSTSVAQNLFCEEVTQISLRTFEKLLDTLDCEASDVLIRRKEDETLTFHPYPRLGKAFAIDRQGRLVFRLLLGEQDDNLPPKQVLWMESDEVRLVDALLRNNQGQPTEVQRERLAELSRSMDLLNDEDALSELADVFARQVG
jgi:DNA-binding Xre family transcriptional regulator